jgi:spermidine/putrescine transport system substrate-binding protein
MDLLAKEEIYVTEAWSGRVAALQQQGHTIGYLDPQNSFGWEESMMVLKGSPVAEVEELLNFMIEPATAIAVAEGQNYPPAHDPSKVEMTEKIKSLPAFDPTGKLEHFAFADPTYWTDNEAEWKRAWSRIERGA